MLGDLDKMLEICKNRSLGNLEPKLGGNLSQLSIGLIVSTSLSMGAKFYNFQNGSMRLFHHSKGFCSVLGQRFYKISTKFPQNVH